LLIIANYIFGNEMSFDNFNNELAYESIGLIDFQSVTSSSEVMASFDYDVPQIHSEVRAALAEKVKLYKSSNTLVSQPLVPIVGHAGAGKTFLLSDLYAQTIKNNGYFVTFDLTDPEKIYEQINCGIIDCLTRQSNPEMSQLAKLLYNIMDSTTINMPPTLTEMHNLIAFEKDPSVLSRAVNNIIVKIANNHPKETLLYTDIIHCLFFLFSDNFEFTNIAFSWLQNIQGIDYTQSPLKLKSNYFAPKDIFYGLNWLMSLNNAFTVLAIDQLDALLLNYVIKNPRESKGLPPKRDYIRENAEYLNTTLAELQKNSRRTIFIGAFLNDAWEILKKFSTETQDKSFDDIIVLNSIKDSKIAESIVIARINKAYAETGFIPPYKTYPFPPKFFDIYEGFFPREILQKCEKHISKCIMSGKPMEWEEEQDTVAPTPPLIDTRIESRFNELLKDQDIDKYKNESQELFWQDILNSLAQCLIYENDNLPKTHEIIYKRDLNLKSKNPMIHINFQYQENSVTVRTLAIWVILQQNATAFASRLKNAVTSSGISKKIKNISLTVIRFTDVPKGTVTRASFEDFKKNGGSPLNPGNEEISRLKAIKTIAAEFPQTWPSWARTVKPINFLPVLREPLLWLCNKKSLKGQ
jgi:hypothetical protein